MLTMRRRVRWGRGVGAATGGAAAIRSSVAGDGIATGVAPTGGGNADAAVKDVSVAVGFAGAGVVAGLVGNVGKVGSVGSDGRTGAAGVGGPDDAT